MSSSALARFLKQGLAQGGRLDRGLCPACSSRDEEVSVNVRYLLEEREASARTRARFAGSSAHGPGGAAHASWLRALWLTAGWPRDRQEALSGSVSKSGLASDDRG